MIEQTFFFIRVNKLQISRVELEIRYRIEAVTKKHKLSGIVRELSMHGNTERESLTAQFCLWMIHWSSGMGYKKLQISGAILFLHVGEIVIV